MGWAAARIGDTASPRSHARDSFSARKGSLTMSAGSIRRRLLAARRLIAAGAPDHRERAVPIARAGDGPQDSRAFARGAEGDSAA